MTTNTTSAVYKLQVAAFIVFCFGHGWNGATFSPVDDVLITSFHLFPIVLLLLFGVQFFSEHDQQLRGEAAPHWGQIGITVLAIIAIIADIVLIIIGQTNPDPNSVGVHDFTDWVPATMTLLGSFLWLAGQLLARRANATATQVSSR
ncbi:MAG: hypothetical protein DLM69_12490 [Candidatus Chloroheliales bacterium]|nr:MAG: hypothetical protein DLM69_12490 [Chloroflexota bacterium]